MSSETSPMQVAYANRIITGDALTELARMPAEMVQCIITSPPYFGLRDYGVAGQIGLEPSPAAYIERLVAVFRQARRVLRDDGTLWLNIGDSYVGSGKGYGSQDHGKLGKHAVEFLPPPDTSGVPAKNLLGIPWRVAFALQADGWYLRSDIIEEVELYCPCGCGFVLEERIWRHSPDREIIWHKPNAMPESVKDRVTKSHEYVFHLAKSERYYYDADAIREPHARTWGDGRAGGSLLRASRVDDLTRGSGWVHRGDKLPQENPAGRNKRSVWSIPTKPYLGAHFAVMPPALVETCLLAGTSPQACERCGAPWQRVIDKLSFDRTRDRLYGGTLGHNPSGKIPGSNTRGMPNSHPSTTGWQPTCRCPDNTGSGCCLVLDPFFGSGTVGEVAIKHSRAFLGIELNEEYVRLAEERTANRTVWATG